MVLLQRELTSWVEGRTARELLDLLGPVLNCADRMITKSNSASIAPRNGVEPIRDRVLAVYDAQCELEEAIRETLNKMEGKNANQT